MFANFNLNCSYVAVDSFDTQASQYLHTKLDMIKYIQALRYKHIVDTKFKKCI